MFFISFIKTPNLKKTIIPLFIISFLLLALVPIYGVEVKGAKRWLDFYIIRLQPIELLKPFFILATVKILTLEKLEKSQIRYLFCFLLLASVIILLIDQPDLGQSILLIRKLDCYGFHIRIKLIFHFRILCNFYNFNKLFIIFNARKICLYNQ